MSDFDEKKYEEFKKWIDSVSTNVTDVNEASKVCLKILDNVLDGKKFIDGDFRKTH